MEVDEYAFHSSCGTTTGIELIDVNIGGVKVYNVMIDSGSDPTIDEFLVDMNQSTVFSKVDLKRGFRELQLEEESRSITIFTTHSALFRNFIWSQLRS